MLYVNVIAFIAVLLTCISITEAVPLEKRHSFKVRARKRDHTGHPHAGHYAMLKAYRKFGFSVSQSLGALNYSRPQQTGTVQAVPEPNDSEFLEKVDVGGQTLVLDFDTGSSDLWVFSTKLSSQTIGQHTAFDSEKSQTFSPMSGSTWEIQYGDGSGASGEVGTDTVNIGGATVTKQAIELATAVSDSFVQDTNNDGLVGLAFSKINTVQPAPVKTFFDNVMPSLKKPVFSVDLRSDGTGTYEFGNVNTTKVAGGQLTTVPVDAESGFWQFSSSRASIGTTLAMVENSSPAIADTGTTLMVVDDVVAKAYYEAVKGSRVDNAVGGFVYPCDADLPDFGVAVGDNYMATIAGKDITFAKVDQTNCFGSIQSNGGGNLQIYGDVFFKSQYVVFDGQAKALHLGPKA